MYSVGEEFEKLIEDDVEYLTCIANVNIGDKEYLVCENESGVKRVFYYDSIDEDIELLDEDESDEILEVWEEEYYGADKDYMYWNEEFGEYDEVPKEGENIDGFADTDEFDIDDDDIDGLGDIEEDEDLDDFLEDFLDDDSDEY